MVSRLPFRNIKNDFIEIAVTYNRIILRVSALFVLFAQLFNVIRVIFLSDSGLSSINNRTYFTFYIIYFIGCILFLIIDAVPSSTVIFKYKFYMVCGSMFMMWHTIFNIFDTFRANAVGSFTILTAMTVFCALLIMRPIYVLTNFAVSYVIFSIFLYKSFGSGEVINFTFAAILCIIIYAVRYRQLYNELMQKHELNDLRNKLFDSKQNFKLSCEQQALILNKEHYITFEWNIHKDWIRFSKEWNDVFGEPCEIANFSSYIKNLKVISPQQKKQILSFLKKAENNENFQKYELLLPIKNGKKGWFELRAATQSVENSVPVFCVGMLTDITIQKERILQLEQEIQMDLFTEVLNKISIERYGIRKISQLLEGEILAALILDIANFKDINDNYGHPAGDRVLKDIASIMRKNSPIGARIGRIGGDEFIVIMVTDHIDEFISYGQTLLKEIASLKVNGINVDIRCSIGISFSNQDTKEYQQLYSQADTALYNAKKSGKNKLCIYGEDDYERKKEEVSVR